MATRSPRRKLFFTTAFACLVGAMLTACQHFGLKEDCDSFQADEGKGLAKVCLFPTVRALAYDVDKLEHHIELYGSVVTQTPSVWGQARMTKHRQEFEDQMYAELGNFAFSLQGSLARSDQAFFNEALAL